MKRFAEAISEHLTRALRARLPMLREVVDMSEREFLTIGDIVQAIRGESKQQVADLESVDRQIGRAGEAHPEPATTMHASMDVQQRAHGEFLVFCQAVDAQLVRHETLARTALQAVRQIADIAARFDQITMSATMVAINARVESARLGAAGKPFNVVADEL